MTDTLLDSFAVDTLNGLSANPRYLLSKYLYDTAGSRIFCDIMNMPEYYLTGCEWEIFDTHKERIRGDLFGGAADPAIIEFGAGDGLKTKVLLRHFLDRGESFTYVPIDICRPAVETLVDSLGTVFPALSVEGKVGDYFEVMHDLDGDGSQCKVILFLGSNIGNYNPEETARFLTGLRRLMNPHDRLFIGFDLIKDPAVILAAYNDPHGHTRDFNLNLLTRINRELNADFDPGHFMHYEHYDPASGAARSYLISTREQTVTVSALDRAFTFREWEPIHIEISQKYDMDMIRRIAAANGFEIIADYFDRRRWFVNSLWQAAQ